MNDEKLPQWLTDLLADESNIDLNKAMQQMADTRPTDKFQQHGKFQQIYYILLSPKHFQMYAELIEKERK